LKVLVTNNDYELINELSYLLSEEGIDIHIGNQGASSLPGSGAYQQSIYILDVAEYHKAQEILNDLDECRKPGYENNKLGISSEKNKKSNKWLVFLGSMLIVLLLCLAAL